jgi:hypothetical protein
MGILAGSGVLVAGLMVAGAGVAAADTGCLQAGTSGFTAKVVAHAGQTISRRAIDAAGCDVGIYVADAASHVTISRVRVTGANAAGILVENTSHVTVRRSVVTGNGFHTTVPASHDSSNPGELPQAFGISLFGVSRAVVTGNTVYNNGRGGIGVMDTGPFDPGHIIGLGTSPDQPVPVRDVTVSRNILWANYNGCAIVVSAFHTDNTARNVDITGNTVVGTGVKPGVGADVGGIVAQSNGPGSTVRDITIARNVVTRSGEAGVIVHAAAPGSQTRNVVVDRNILSANNQLYGPPPGAEVDNTAGVVVSTLGPAQNVHTVVSRNIIFDQFYGVWTHGPNPPRLSRNLIWVTSGGSTYYVAP